MPRATLWKTVLGHGKNMIDTFHKIEYMYIKGVAMGNHRRVPKHTIFKE